MKCELCDKEKEITNEMVLTIDGGSEVCKGICQDCAKKIVNSSGTSMSIMSVNLERKFNVGEICGIYIGSKKE